MTQLQQEVQTLAAELDRKNRQCEALQRAVTRKDEEMDSDARAISALRIFGDDSLRRRAALGEGRTNV